jgi:XapX domain-containing protein
VKVYLLSLGAGLLVGVIYGLLNVRSPAPPVIALVGRMIAGHSISAAWHGEACGQHVFGQLPGRPQRSERA